jgi:hypothetical protein
MDNAYSLYKLLPPPFCGILGINRQQETAMSITTKTNFQEVRLDDLKEKLAVKIKQKTNLIVAPQDILAVDPTTHTILFFKRTDNKGRRNRASFHTINIKTGQQAELFQNPLAKQEIDTLGILF